MKDEIYSILSLLGEEDKTAWQRAMSPPIYQTSNFRYESFEAFEKAIQKERENSLYTRGQNPTVRLLEQKLAALQGTEDAICFASGSGAIAAAVICFCKAGDHIVIIKNSYSWTQKLVVNLLSRFGVSHTFVDGRNTNGVKSAFNENTRMLILESPTSFMFELQDVKALTEFAHSQKCKVMADNSYASPLSQFPAICGVDLITHSATKYISGHSDAVAGVICASKTDCDEIFKGPYMTLGAALSPFDAWLLIRGLRTLPLRIERVGQTAKELAEKLASMDEIKMVHYPHLPSHPQYQLAKEQIPMPLGMFSIELKDDSKQAVIRFCNQLRLFQMAVSWGSYESLVFPSALFETNPFPPGTIRFSVGIEPAAELYADIVQALRS
jgi:cystathionine beta-lyase/cystathionine gamma-synthase